MLGTDGGWRHTLNNVQGGAALALGVVVGAEAGVTLDKDECSAEARHVSWSDLVRVANVGGRAGCARMEFDMSISPIKPQPRPHRRNEMLGKKVC